MVYRAKTPWWLKKLYPNFVWDMPAGDKPAIYLTFDDGPHPEITPWVLQQLHQHKAKASFFCIGNNVQTYHSVFEAIGNDGHATGNHTFNHMNGWSTEPSQYIADVEKAQTLIRSRLFRPPYGKIKQSQSAALLNMQPAWTIYMWDVLSGDFDHTITAEQCLENVVNNIRPGSIVVFHDSEKAKERMQYALPKVLKYCNHKNWEMKPLP
jgi:peptidoglycan-N-acetylglucosamine deacetylase